MADKQTVSSSDANTSNVSSEESKAPSGEQISSDKKFNMTYQDLIQHLDESAAKKQYPKLSGEKPKKESIKIDGVGTVDCYTYSISEGVDLLLYCDPTDNCMTQIMCFADKEKVTKDSMKKYGYYLGVIEGGMAGDRASEVDQKLNLDNTQKDASTVAKSDNCVFSYIVSKDSLIVTIMPNK